MLVLYGCLCIIMGRLDYSHDGYLHFLEIQHSVACSFALYELTEMDKKNLCSVEERKSQILGWHK